MSSANCSGKPPSFGANPAPQCPQDAKQTEMYRSSKPGRNTILGVYSAKLDIGVED